jgi:hypothetical protein
MAYDLDDTVTSKERIMVPYGSKAFDG